MRSRKRRPPSPPPFSLWFSLLVIGSKQVESVDVLQNQATDDLSLFPLGNVSLPTLIHRLPVEECHRSPSSPLKVFVYDLPTKFNVGLFGNGSDNRASRWLTEGRVPFRRREDGTIAGIGFEHSPESFITVDLLHRSEVNSATTQGNEVVRMQDPASADVFFVPFLASMSFNKHSGQGMHSALVEHDRQLQEELIQILASSEWWQRSGGADHVLSMTHPNALRFVRTRISRATFLVADFGRSPHSVSSLAKDVVLPYNHILPTFSAEGASLADADETWVRRTTTLYFQGAVKRKNEGYIRQILYDMLHEEEDVHFASSRADAQGVLSATQGMRNAKFCLNAAGDTPSSCRLFDAIVNHCVPLIISNKLELPFESALDYSEFAVFLSHEEALQRGHLLKLLRGMSKEEWLRRWRRMIEVQGMFEFQVPSTKGDAISMMWREVKNRLPQVRRRIHEYQRKLLTKLS